MLERWSSSPRSWRLRPQAPGQCEVCRAWGAGAVCGDCLGRFAAPRPRCLLCALPMTQAGLTCGACLAHKPPWSGLTCAVDYGFPWDRLIIDLKFHARTELAGALAQRLTDAVRQEGVPCDIELVLPVPLSAKRLAERGFNQAWEVARRVAGDLALQADHSLLLRPIDTPHQADLPREERARNLRGALMVDPRRRGRVLGRHLALVDDVFTTGATAREATQALLRAGAASVRVWAIARTP